MLQIKKRFAIFYWVILLAFSVTNLSNFATLGQVKPVFFYNAADFTSNLLQASNVMSYLFAHPQSFFVLDGTFILLHTALVVAIIKSYSGTKVIAVIASVFTLFYGLISHICTTFSMQGYTPFVFLPLVFMGGRLKSFYFGFHLNRYWFALLFASAGIWKFRTGAIFHPEQMGAILFQQHAVYLSSNVGSTFRSIINYIINHQWAAISLYIVGALAELVFLSALFTKRFDRILGIVLISFLIMDYLLMKINFFSWLAFLPLFWYSKKVTLSANE